MNYCSDKRSLLLLLDLIFTPTPQLYTTEEATTRPNKILKLQKILLNSIKVQSSLIKSYVQEKVERGLQRIGSSDVHHTSDSIHLGYMCSVTKQDRKREKQKLRRNSQSTNTPSGPNQTSVSRSHVTQAKQVFFKRFDPKISRKSSTSIQLTHHASSMPLTLPFYALLSQDKTTVKPENATV